MALGTGIPAKAVEKIIPLLVKQMKGLSKLIGKLKQSIASIPPGAKCNDPAIKQMKKNLEKLKKLISNIRKILKSLDKIRKAINIAAGIAAAISIIQLIIPLPPFAPPGPIAKLIKIVGDLAANCKSAVLALAGILAAADLIISLADVVLADALKEISNRCPNEAIQANTSTAQKIADDVNQNLIDQGITDSNSILNNGGLGGNGGGIGTGADGSITGVNKNRGIVASPRSANVFTNVSSITDGNGNGATFDVTIVNNQYSSINVNNAGSGYEENDQIIIRGNLLGGTSPANDLSLSATGVFNKSTNGLISNLGQYDSIFYTKYNVSGEDLMKLEDDVNDLVDEARNILTNLIEAPSRAYIEFTPPSPKVGYEGDYYIDLTNQLVYGPKPSDESWGQPSTY